MHFLIDIVAGKWSTGGCPRGKCSGKCPREIS